MVLAELSEPESLAMVREALDVADLPAEVGEAIYAKTKGNPLFLEEVIHSLQAPRCAATHPGRFDGDARRRAGRPARFPTGCRGCSCRASTGCPPTRAR